MPEVDPGVAELLVSIAALERARPMALIEAVDVDGDVATLALGGGTSVSVPLGTSEAGLAAAVSGVTGGAAGFVPTPEQFPVEPLTAHEKWVELLDDLGGWYGMLDRLRPGLRLASLRRDTDPGPGHVARITVTDGRRSAVTEVSLDDGLIVVGLADDLATSFDDQATPDSTDS